MLTLSRTVADQGRLIAFSTRLLEKSGVKPLTARQTWRPWTSFRLGRVFSSLGSVMRRNSRIAALIAGPVITICALPGFASAQDATWVGAISSDWNTGPNWNGSGVPTGIATFNPSTQMSITFSAPATVQTLLFDAPGYTFNFSIPATTGILSITGEGIVAAPTNAPTFSFDHASAEFTNSSTAGPASINAFNGGAVAFFDTSKAGTATIQAGVQGSINDFDGGFIFFEGNSTADHATITALGD